VERACDIEPNVHTASYVVAPTVVRYPVHVSFFCATSVLSFSKLGRYGRLGNQLFQYAYLRTQAERLHTTFYCPAWDGDDIFDLDDEGAREPAAQGIQRHFNSDPHSGFWPEACRIGDHTEIEGFFQSERYYVEPARVRGWYRFVEPLVDRVRVRADLPAFNESASLSLRIDADYGSTREFWPLYPLSFYQRALKAIDHQGPIVVFADNIPLARAFFAPMAGRGMRFVEGFNAAEQLFLMTQCKANVITNSSFAWWGAWLQQPGRVVAAPSAWCRPGVPDAPVDILASDWLRVRGTVPVWDHFQVWRIRHPLATVHRIVQRVTSKS
jgi:Glycosyl transferase family 11